MDVPEGKKNIGGDDSKGQLNANQNFSRFLPYQTNCLHSSKKSPKENDPCLFGRAKIWKTFVGFLEEMTTS